MSEIAKRLETLQGEIVDVVRRYVEKATTATNGRVDAVEKLVAGIPAAPDAVVVRGMVSDEVKQAVATLPAPKDGKDGKDGKDCDMAAVQILVDAAVKAAVASLPKVENGEDGRDGRDALEVEIVSLIQPTKQYPRGTWAKHAGGVVRAFRDTDPITDEIDRSGWEVVVDGLKGIEIEQAGDRGFRVVAERTSGTKSALECDMPVLLDRGRYSDSKGYELGDVVDWSGSMWKAEKDTTGVEPRPDTPEWRLLVRRGRDGKDGIVRTVEPAKVKV